AREYIEKLNRPYEYEDLLLIAKGQASAEDTLAETANGVLIVDTTLTVMRVWSEHKYNRCDPWIIQEEQNRRYDLLLVCDIDLPWEEDPQREHPHLREHFFRIYKEYAEAHPSYRLISGGRATRLDTALRAVGLLSGGSKPPRS
ncbi:MAG: ATP-binding protein, partial [Bacteroidota bacterium]